MKNIEAVGKIVWLMGQSEVHQALDIADIHRVVLPPVALGQYRLWEADGFPVGYMTWALFNEETEARSLDGTRYIQPNDWNARQNLWLVDFVVPFGNIREMVREGRDHLRDIFGKGVTGRARRSWKGKQWFAVT